MINYRLFVLLYLIVTLVKGGPVSVQARLVVHTPVSKKELGITLTSVDMISFKPLPVAHTTQRGLQSTVLQVPIDQPRFISLDVDGAYALLYLSPGDSLHIYVDDSSPKQVTRFTGRGAQANEYLAKATAIRLRAEQPNGKLYFSLSTPEFIAHLKTVEQAYQHLNQTYLAKTTLAKSVKILLAGRNRVNLLFMKQNYVLTHEEGSTDSLPVSIKKATASLPFDARFLHASLPEYAMIVNVYVGYLLPKQLSSQVVVADQMPLYSKQCIQASAYPAPLKEYLLAKNCYNWLQLVGLTPATERLLADYKAQFAQSEYLLEVNRLYQKWRMLSPGQPAPDFYGVTLKGDTTTLRSLRGKVIYVDVWATWCAPCRAEFPQAKVLQARFAGNPNVAFMYVSVDQDQAAWKKFVQSDPAFEGIHINQASEEQAGSLWKPYLLTGIPRYILIDQHGLLVEINAAKPSSGTVATAIEALLK